MKIVRAWDESGHEWLIDFETRRAFPAIAGGDDRPVPPESCPYHRECHLRHLNMVTTESARLFGVHDAVYCPLLECDYVTWSPFSGTMALRDKILLLVAVQQKVFFKKFAEQFVGNGKQRQA